ncbi:methyltransferase family protein [Desulfosporosinus lacus]|uniref:Dimerisation domain-containing protein n=1 Tax=Desulfosporosinus lacus DSM 15449 TaxID=1121420 RepID=A0A1M5Y475_9FIRM|nr:methyltransferase dimerization domain-containing protein [Desulfosporosinus lacus]SHI06871.1 Dimerisation domain-containing protein [Desulfosporosinus lacus DSM 15449]
MGLAHFLRYNPHEVGSQYLEDLATGYWFSEVLFTGVELDVFTFLECRGMTTHEIAGALDMPPIGWG